MQKQLYQFFKSTGGGAITLVLGLVIIFFGVTTFVVSGARVGETLTFPNEFKTGDFVLFQRIPRVLAADSMVVYRHPVTQEKLLGLVAAIPGDLLELRDPETDEVIYAAEPKEDEYFIITTLTPFYDSRSIGPIHRSEILGAVFKHMQ